MQRKDVRVRFAPSPTGPLHIGGVRTALYNYLFAKKHNGRFILRIEDTDQKRFVKGAEEYIIESLNWIGIKVDEGVSRGGPHEPYNQSKRKEIYHKYAQQLIDQGHAYYAFDTSEELESMRSKLKEEGAANISYNARIRANMRNSISLDKHETKNCIDSGANYVIRLKMPENEKITISDMIRGHVEFDTALLDDKVLFKSDGLPTYHLANVVDDYLMGITHVIRGEEWLPSLALHYLLYKYLGWEHEIPQFAHLPLILKPDGKGKLSKRDGDRMGFPVFPLDWKHDSNSEIFKGFRECGYLPEATLNYLSLLGWNPGTDQELFSLSELFQAFDIEKVQKSGAKFDPEKAKWINQQYIKNQCAEDLLNKLKPYIHPHYLSKGDDYLIKILSVLKERLELLQDFNDQAAVFFERPTEFDQKLLRKKWKENTPNIVSGFHDAFTTIEEWTLASIDKFIQGYCQQHNISPGALMLPLRLVISGKGGGPSVAEMIWILGKEESLFRIKNHSIVS